MLIFSFPNLYAHEWKCPMLSKLCFLDVSGPTIYFSRVAVGNLHPAHHRSKAPISPWPAARPGAGIGSMSAGAPALVSGPWGVVRVPGRPRPQATQLGRAWGQMGCAAAKRPGRPARGARCHGDGGGGSPSRRAGEQVAGRCAGWGRGRKGPAGPGRLGAPPAAPPPPDLPTSRLLLPLWRLGVCGVAGGTPFEIGRASCRERVSSPV